MATNPRGGGPAASTAESLGTVAMPPIAPMTETNWAPPDVDDERPKVEAGASCAINEVTAAAGARVEELVKNVERFTATEEMEHESLSPLGVQISRDTRTFNYLVAIRQIGARELDVQEYRNGSVSMQQFPAPPPVHGRLGELGPATIRAPGERASPGIAREAPCRGESIYTKPLRTRPRTDPDSRKSALKSFRKQGRVAKRGRW